LDEKRGFSQPTSSEDKRAAVDTVLNPENHLPIDVCRSSMACEPTDITKDSFIICVRDTTMRDEYANITEYTEPGRLQSAKAYCDEHVDPDTGRTSLHTTSTDMDGKVVVKPYEL
jgi:hypothetical protein